MSRKETIKSAFESMMFVWGEPLDVKVAADIFNIDRKEAYDYFKELQAEYETQGRGIRIREIDKSFQLCTWEENDEYIQRLCTPVKEKRLTQSAMETLAIIAYKQPTTRPEIDSIRGVNSDGVVRSLLSKGLIEELGRSEAPGRPILYGVTPEFLQHFGLEGLDQLPEIDFEAMFSTPAEAEADERRLLKD